MQWFRRIQALGLLAILGVVGAASLSDQAPRAIARTVRDLRGGAGQFDYFGLTDVLVLVARAARAEVPFGVDTIGHFAVWGAVGFVSAGLLTRAADRLSLLIGLFTLSALLEAGQHYLSWSRSASLGDLAANGFGLVAGYLCYTVVERLVIANRHRWPSSPFRSPRLSRAGGGSLH